jgi:hypothetical protein
VRHEVRDLKDRYPDQWNLYLLGLSSLQWTPQSDPLSYYSLAGKCHRYRELHVTMLISNRQVYMGDLTKLGAMRQGSSTNSVPLAIAPIAIRSSLAGTAHILRCLK